MNTNPLPTLPRRAVLRGAAGLAAVFGGAALVPALSALAGSEGPARGEYFVFVHAAGGWDVTLWSDPRNERRGVVDPATTEHIDPTGIRHFRPAPFDGQVKTFEPVVRTGTPFAFGPGIGGLLDLADRLTLVNGIAMNTVSHPEGIIYSSTGRRSLAGRVAAPSVDVVLADALGRESLFPALSVGFPSYHVGPELDRRAAPLRVGSIHDVARLLSRAEVYETADDRRRISEVLSAEARDLAGSAPRPGALEGMAQQLESLQKMTSGSLSALFDAAALQKAYPRFDHGARFAGPSAVTAAFAVEAMRRDLARCVSFAVPGFDTHATNYRLHLLALQELFDLVTALVRTLDETPHPTLTSDRLSDHTHVLVLSEFCRTPQMNQAGGRDHYPDNSALVISPRMRHPCLFGATDPAELLPLPAPGFTGGPRPITPADLLATFLHAMGVDARGHPRDGEIVGALLNS